MVVGLWALCAHAQVQDIAAWTAVLASPEISGRTRLWLDVHARRDAAAFLSIVRPGVGLQLTDQVSAWVGGAWIPTLPDDGALSSELRIWEQAIVNVQLGSEVGLSSRTRLEQRISGGGGALGWRIREFVRLSIEPSTSDGPRLALWDEVFLGLNDTDWGAVAGFDQNRLFVGVGLPVAHGGRVELGVVNVVAQRDELRMTWVVAANWFVPRGVLRPRQES